MKATVVMVLVAAMAAWAQPPYVIWDRTYGGDQNDFGNDIIAVDSSGCVIVGTTSSFGAGGTDVYMLRINGDGDTLWTRTFGGIEDNEGRSVARTTDSGFVICGSSAMASYLIRTDLDGNLVWARTQLSSYHGYDVIQTADGGFAFTGATSVMYSCSFFLVKTDSVGVVQWNRDYGEGNGYSIRQTADGGYLIAGSRLYFDEEPDVFIVRTNDLGDTLWTRTVGGEFTDIAYDVELTRDGGCIVVGTVGAWEEPYWGYRSLLIRMDAQGDTLWLRTYPEYSFGCEEAAYCVAGARNGGFVLAGNATTWIRQWWTSCYVMKIDSLGNQDWLRFVAGGGYLGECGPTSVAEIEDGDYVACGSCSYWQDSSGYNVWAVRLNEYTGVREIGAPLPYSFKLNPPYPNPFNATATISYEVPMEGRVRIAVYNVLGQRVATVQDQVVTVGEHHILWDAEGLPSGVYFVRMSAGTPSGEAAEFGQTRKVVLLK